jgi:hypothetical protein
MTKAKGAEKRIDESQKAQKERLMSVRPPGQAGLPVCRLSVRQGNRTLRFSAVQAGQAGLPVCWLTGLHHLQM